MSEKRIYVYKCVVDDGGAPCVDNGLLTLTICKPFIRRTARKGDLIVAFGSNNNETPPNRLVYIAEVSRRLPNGSYFTGTEFQNRQDCIYERVSDGRFERRNGARFHNYPAARVSDLGDVPNYPNANALVAEDFRYFGRSGTNDWKPPAPKLCALVEGLGQGHRVNFTSDLLLELIALKGRVWRDNPKLKVLGKPLHAPDQQIDSEEGQVVKICNARCYYQPKRKGCK